MDFVHDQLATGKKIRVLTVVDTFSRFSPAVDPRFSYKGEDVVLTLERVCKNIGYPKSIRVDQGSEFISRDLDLWAYANNVICPQETGPFLIRVFCAKFSWLGRSTSDESKPIFRRSESVYFEARV